MTKVHPIQKSIVAEYLIKNKAITKKDGNVRRFYSPEGLYLGNQTKGMMGNNVETYTTTIYGEGVRPIYQKRVMLSMTVARITNQKSGNPYIPVNIRKSELFIDFLDKEYKTHMTEKLLRNELNFVKEDELNGNIYYEVQNYPTVYDTIIDGENPDLAKVKFGNYRVYNN